jgi:hypothetical protein
MLTIIGKTLVYSTLILSLVGLGVSVWAVADTTDYKVLIPKINDEIVKEEQKVRQDKELLKAVVEKSRARTTTIPRGPDELKANKDVTIAEAESESADNEKKLTDIFGETQLDVQARINLINELQSLRNKLAQEKETGNNLRLIMYPDEARARDGQRSFRDIIASLQVAKEEVEKRITGMQPDLYNSSIRLQNLLLRQKGLQDRADELKK